MSREFFLGGGGMKYPKKPKNGHRFFSLVLVQKNVANNFFSKKLQKFRLNYNKVIHFHVIEACQKFSGVPNLL